MNSSSPPESVSPLGLWQGIMVLANLLPCPQLPPKVFSLDRKQRDGPPNLQTDVQIVSAGPVTTPDESEISPWDLWENLGGVVRSGAPPSEVALAAPSPEQMHDALTQAVEFLREELAKDRATLLAERKFNPAATSGGAGSEEIYRSRLTSARLFVCLFGMYVQTRWSVPEVGDGSWREARIADARIALKILPPFGQWHQQCQDVARRFARQVVDFPALTGSSGSSRPSAGQVLDESRLAFYRQFGSFRDEQHELPSNRYHYVALLFTERRIVVDTSQTRNRRFLIQFPDGVEEREVLEAIEEAVRHSDMKTRLRSFSLRGGEVSFQGTAVDHTTAGDAEVREFLQ